MIKFGLESVIIIFFLFQAVQNAPNPFNFLAPRNSNSDDKPDPANCAEAAKDLLGSSGKGLYGVVRDTSSAAYGATKFCLVECLKIFEKAINSAMSFDFMDVGGQGVKFVKCFFLCVQQVLGAVTTSVKSASNFVGMSGSSVSNFLGATTSDVSKLASVGAGSASNLFSGIYNRANSLVQ